MFEAFKGAVRISLRMMHHNFEGRPRAGTNGIEGTWET